MDKDETRKKTFKNTADLAKKVSNHTDETTKRNRGEETSKGSQADLEKRLNQFLALQRACATIHSTMALRDIITKIAEAAVNILGYDHSFVIAFDEDKNIPSETVFFSKAGLELTQEVEADVKQKLKTAQIQEDQEVDVEPSLSPEYDTLQEMLGVKSRISVPLTARDHLVGNIVAFTVREDISETEEQPLWILANQAAIAIDNVRLYDEALVNTQRLRESREMSRITLENAVAGVSIVQDGRFQYVNPIFEEMLGYTSEELIGKPTTDFIHPDDRERVVQEAIDSLKGNIKSLREFRLIKRDGGIVWVLEKVVSIKFKAKRAALAIALDVTELKHVEQALRESEEKLKIIFDSIKEGIIVTDLSGKIIKENQTGLRMFEYDRENEAFRQDIFAFIAEKNREEAKLSLIEALKQGQGYTKEFTLTTKNGIEFDGEISATILRDSAGNPSGFICVIRDITIRKKMDQAKSDFVALVSHQLKTPVAGIRGYIENMLDGLTGELNEKQKRYLSDMRALCLRNYTLISDLLNTSMIERGILSIDLGPTRLSKVVNTVIKDHYSKIEEKGLTLKVAGMNGEEIIVLADMNKLIEALSNIVNNCIKFTDQGSIVIKISHDNKYGFVEVNDTGKGMSHETLEELFRREKILSGGPVAGGGAGLGLYIAKGFMKAQNGDITAESTIGKGSTFILNVPLYREEIN